MTLTREEILAMEAGRELDALVAEQVMGWKNTGKRVSLAYRAVMTMHTDKTGTYRRVPNCSTDIYGAWEVIGKIKEKYEVATLDYRNKWVCYLVETITESGNLDTPDIEAYGQTAPEAICKAALLAMLDYVEV